MHPGKRIVILVVSILSGTAFAGEPAWPAGDAAVVDGWEPEVEVFVRTHSLGYESAKVIAPDGENQVLGSTLRQASGDVRARLLARGRYAQLELQVYTQIPSDALMVTTGALEAWVLVPLAERVRVGFYHNSAHNFSDAEFGWGTDVNAFVADSLLLSRRFQLLGDELRLRLQADAYLMLKGKASPYALTAETDVLRPGIGNTAGRGSVLLLAAHPIGRADLILNVFGAEDWVPASLDATVGFGWRPGRMFLGILGEHVLAGPYLTYRRNFSQLSVFGTDSYTAGVRIELLITEDPVFKTKK